MTDSTPTNPADRGDAHSTGGHSSGPGTNPADEPTMTYPSSPAGWGAAPTPTSTATLDAPAPFSGPTHQYAGDSAYGTATGPYAASWNPSAPNGATPWYGAGATTRRKRGPKPPWFWPVIAVAVGLAALLAGGGIGFAIGHAIGGGTSRSTTHVPGTNGGTNQLPGDGTGQFPGNGTQGGTGTNGGTGTQGGTGTGSDTSGSTSNS